MNALASPSLCNTQISRFHLYLFSQTRNSDIKIRFPIKDFRTRASSNDLDTKTEQGSTQDQEIGEESKLSSASALDKDLKKVRDFSVFHLLFSTDF